MKDSPIIFPNHSAFFPSVNAAVLIQDSQTMFAKPDADPLSINWEKQKNLRKVVPWGEDNDLPQLIIQKVAASPDLSTGISFNIKAGYGEGIMVAKYVFDEEGKKKIIPISDNKEINEFFEHNDINGYLLEQLTDMEYFFNVFPEIILNQEDGNKRKVVELTSKEAAFSRWEEMNPKTGLIDHHFYNALWDEKVPAEDQVVVSPVLHPKHPIRDILQRMGRIPGNDGKTVDKKEFRFIIPINFPSPGRTYYQKPYWYSIIESGWYDFAIAIPKFKKYLIQNGMTIRYVIYLEDSYFPDLFKREGISDAAKMEARIKKEYTDLNNFLTGMENAGKSMVSFYKSFPDGKKQYRVEIVTVKNEFKGGEYIEDTSEVSNMIAFTLSVHPSVIGASPGKNNSFSGSDKRELFIIKQALLKPIRDRLLRPLYVIKAINKWPDEVQFLIPNIELTTLDKNKSGVETKAI